VYRLPVGRSSPPSVSPAHGLAVGYSNRPEGRNASGKGRPDALRIQTRRTPDPVWLLAGILLLVGIASSGSVLLLQRDYRFDDAFISYRYAKNLAEGYGLRWNRGEAPVEGYTNFLLVVALAPFVKGGLDPLRVTQVLSILAAGALGWMLARLARRDYGATRAEALLVVGIFLSLGALGFLCVLGVETVIYTAALFATFASLAVFFETSRARSLVAACLGLLAAFLLRPEALILAVAAALTLVGPRRPSSPDYRALVRARHGWIVASALLVPILVYATWKVIHFGDLLPTPFYVKASGTRLVSPLGIESVLGYYDSVKVGVALAVIAAILPRRAAASRKVALAFVVLYTLFYVRVDTLMDAGYRFLYPVTPFLTTLAMPTAVALGRALRRGPGIWMWPRALAVTTAALLALYPAPLETARNIGDAARGRSVYAEIPQGEYVLAQRLAQYEDVRNLTIALGDAGLVPYYTDALVIDGGGLNDRVISRGRNARELVDYAFARRPTLILYPMHADFSFVRSGHGPLGDLAQWAHHPGWRDYAYAGTFKRPAYDVHLFVRRDDPRFDGLAAFLKTRVADVVLDPLPFRLGPG
jgi:arabinofuranosyltransferase